MKRNVQAGLFLAGIALYLVFMTAFIGSCIGNNL